MSASRKRETKETSIEVILEIEGAGIIQVDTGIELLDEILSAIARGAGFDLTVKARGDLETGDHHTTEDTAITLGSTLAQEIKSGIGSSMVPSGQVCGHGRRALRRAGLSGQFRSAVAGPGRHVPGKLQPLPARLSLQRQVQSGHFRRKRRRSEQD